MTLFDPTNTTATPETPSVEGSYLEALVGEGKKFADAEALAKGKYESDNSFIPQLQRENAAQRDLIKELQGKLQEQITMQEFIDEFRKTPGPDDGVTNHEPSTPSVSAQSPDDIAKIIDARLEQERKNAIIQANISQVQQSLATTWGADWQAKLVQKAKDLNLSQEFLADIATKSPTAFLTVVLGDNKVTPTDPNLDVPPRTALSTRVTPIQDNTVRNRSYYDKLKKTNRDLYFSESMTQQRHADAQRLGEAFDN